MTWHHNNGGIDKLSRWIRCLFSLALSEVNIAVQVLDQAVAIAEDAIKVCDASPLKRSSDGPDTVTFVTFAAVQVVPTRRTGMACSNGLQSRN